MLSLELFTLIIIVWLSQFIEIVNIDFSTIGKSIRSSRSHSASTPAVSNAMNYASMVDLVKMVCLQDFYETAPPPNTNTYTLMV
jgi:hypothetical protein